MRKKKQSGNWMRVATVLCAVAAAVGLLRFGYVFYMRHAYPLQYLDQVQIASRAHGIDEAMILAVIHTESEFDEKALSHAGAHGLMQLTEQTFTWAKSRQAPPFESRDIFDPYTNVYYGTLVLQYQYQTFGNWEAALAAYNAGGSVVKAWLEDVRYSADGKTLHTVPYPETEAFIQRVFQAQEMYRILYKL